MDATYEEQLLEILARVQADLAAVRSSNHGTRAGYARHMRNRTPPCDECRAAQAEAQRERRAKKRAATPVTVRLSHHGFRMYEHTFTREEHDAYERGEYYPIPPASARH